MRESQRNRYLDSLNIDAPDLEALVAGDFEGKRWFGKPRLLHLLACTLLEAGRPLSFEEAAARLSRAGLETPKGDLVASLRRSWSGRRPVVKGPKGTVDLDLHAVELEGLVAGLGLRPESVGLSAVPDDDEEEPDESPVVDDRPLSRDDLRCAFTGADLVGLNGARQAAAVVDAHGGAPMPQAEVETLLAKLTVDRPNLGDALPEDWVGSPASLDEKDRVVLNRSHRRMDVLRRNVRRRAREARRLAREEAEAEAAEIEWFRQENLKWDRDHAAYLSVKRAVLHVVPNAQHPVAGALLAFPPGGGEERLSVFPPGKLQDLVSAIGEQDVIAGEDPRAALLGLGCDPHATRLIDLKPQSWTVQGAGGRRSTKLTRRSLLRVATGHVPLHGTSLKRLLESDDRERIVQQLRLDVWALATLYRCGVLHLGVGFMSGTQLMHVVCDWSLPGEENIVGFLGEAGRAQVEVECRSHPGGNPAAPWQNARRGEAHAVGPQTIIMRGRKGFFEIDTWSVRDVRRAVTKRPRFSPVRH